jgi:hypothetical protein
MNFMYAVRSGRPFKRAHWPSHIYPDAARYSLEKEDVLAEDYELKQPELAAQHNCKYDFIYAAESRQSLSRQQEALKARLATQEREAVKLRECLLTTNEDAKQLRDIVFKLSARIDCVAKSELARFENLNARMNHLLEAIDSVDKKLFRLKRTQIKGKNK